MQIERMLDRLKYKLTYRDFNENIQIIRTFINCAHYKLQVAEAQAGIKAIISCCAKKKCCVSLISVSIDADIHIID